MASKRTGRSGREKPGRVWLRRLLWGGGGAVVLAFAIEGGEYGSTDLWSQREARASLEAELTDLRDSAAVLRAQVQAVRTDTVLLERMAREQWGMVKPGELLYWVRDPGAERSAEQTADSSASRVARP